MRGSGRGTAANELGCAVGAGAAAAKLELVVEEEVARGFAVLDGESGESVMLFMKLQHAREIDGADDIDVVQDEGLVEAADIFKEEPGGFSEAAAGVEQDVFARDFDAHAEIVFGFQVAGNHVGEVMDVDDDFANAEGAQAGEGDFEQRAAGDFDEGLGAIVGERPEARAEAGGEDHGFHWETLVKKGRVASGEWRVSEGKTER